MAAWLKLIGSARRPITDYTEEYVGFRKRSKPRIRASDQLFLYAPGGSKRIFALAEALGDPERDLNYNPNEEGSCRWKLRVQYLRNLPVMSGILIDEVSSQRHLTKSVRRASHIKLLPEESQSAYERLQQSASRPTNHSS